MHCFDYYSQSLTNGDFSQFLNIIYTLKSWRPLQITKKMYHRLQRQFERKFCLIQHEYILVQMYKFLFQRDLVL
jgi:hypothetical protein